MDLLNSDRRVETEEIPSEPLDQIALPRRLPAAPRNGLASSLERKRLQYYLVMMLADITLLFGSFAAASLAYHGSPFVYSQLQAGLMPVYLLLPLFLTIAMYNGSYSMESLTQAGGATIKMVTALLVSAAMLNFFAFFAKMNAEFSRLIFTSGVIGAFLCMAMFRYAFSRWLVRRWGPNPKNQLVIYAGGPRFTLPFSFHIDAEEHGLGPNFDDPAGLDRLAKYLHNMDEVVVSCRDEDRLHWAEVLKGSGRHGEIVSEFARQIGALGVIHHDTAAVSTFLVSAGRLRMLTRLETGVRFHDFPHGPRCAVTADADDRDRNQIAGWRPGVLPAASHGAREPVL